MRGLGRRAWERMVGARKIGPRLPRYVGEVKKKCLVNQCSLITRHDASGS
jgi:hypothetical protein